MSNPIFTDPSNNAGQQKITSFIPISNKASEAAIQWFRFGFIVIPTLRGQKHSSLTWNAWSEGLNEDKIKNHYEIHSEHEVGCLTNSDLIVFDADSEQSIATLESLEHEYEVHSKLVVKTTRGVHHYFRRAGTIAKQDAHDSMKFPDRIDIRTERSMIILPPSGGRKIVRCEANCLQDLSVVTQNFIDAVFVHNGRIAPSTIEEKSADYSSARCILSLNQLEKIIKLLNPDSGYQDWLRVGLALFYETSGSSEGMYLFDSWSSAGKKYRGTKEIESKWKSFNSDHSHPVTKSTLLMLANSQAGKDAVYVALNEDFEPCSYEVIESEKSALTNKADTTPTTPFLQFALNDKLDEIQRNVRDQLFVLEDISLFGQATVIYAAPNTGKTLITLFLLVDGIKQGRINPSYVYYINVDDSIGGLVDKLKIAQEFGFHMLAEGYADFSASKFFELVSEAIEQGCASTMVLILDTMKKFTNLMDKSQSSNFAAQCRKFVLQGGTVIALGHTNKNRGNDGTLVPGGTSDITDDFDCSFVIDIIPTESADTVTVEFVNRKRRGSVVDKAQFRYKKTNEKKQYREVFDSVEKLTNEMAEVIEYQAKRRRDSLIIDTITGCISSGTVKKMDIAKEVTAQTGETRKRVMAVLESYLGSNPTLHLWTSINGPHGAHIFSLLSDDTKSSVSSL